MTARGGRFCVFLSERLVEDVSVCDELSDEYAKGDE